MHCWYIHTSSSLRGAGETPRRIETSFSFDVYPSVLECVSKPINVWKIRCACAQWIALQKVCKNDVSVAVCQMMPDITIAAPIFTFIDLEEAQWGEIDVVGICSKQHVHC